MTHFGSELRFLRRALVIESSKQFSPHEAPDPEGELWRGSWRRYISGARISPGWSYLLRYLERPTWLEPRANGSEHYCFASLQRATFKLCKKRREGASRSQIETGLHQSRSIRAGSARRAGEGHTATEMTVITAKADPNAACRQLQGT